MKRSAFLVLTLGLIIWLAILADGWALSHLVYLDVYEHDWGRMLRTMGFLPFWLLAGAALMLVDRPGPASPRRGALLMLAPTIAGALGEVLKLLVRRERPHPADGAAYVFRAWSDHPFSSKGFGMPSSHAIVAFAAAAMLARLFPRARVVWYGMAVGCALTRVLSQAHYLSDVTVAAVMGVLVSAALPSVDREP
jgi:membrane-associated phospholipid phosphatase